MKSERPYPGIIISKKGSRSIRKGHPWVYSDEVLSGCSDLENGCLVDVISENGRYLGTGLLSKNSKIRIRILSQNANDRFDEAFWKRRIEYAWNYRKKVMGDDISCCRLIFGEADGFPGLTVDRFSDILVAQCLSFGMEQLKPLLYPLILDCLAGDGVSIRGIYERNDNPLREKEGLSQGKGWFPDQKDSLHGEPVTEIIENAIRYRVDVENGQKTGFFLDQKYNRRAVARLSEGMSVLDCFTHTGSFALNAAFNGARRVTAVDISETAISAARENAGMNGLDSKIEFLREDIFELLPRLCASGEKPYDLIILDPPAFTKSRKTVSGAERGYKEINYRAMKLLPRGGYLATASCSHFMPSAEFERMLVSSAEDAQVRLRQIEARQQSPDHPVLWNVPETDYLKFYLFQIV